MADRPIGAMSLPNSSFTCYTAPGAVFTSEDEMKEHYRSEWHRYNLKRKVAGLAPVSKEVCEERLAREPMRAPGAEPAGSRSQQRRAKREAKAQAKAEASAKNPRSKQAHFEATKELDEEGYIEHKLACAEPFDLCTDIFSRHKRCGSRSPPPGPPTATPTHPVPPRSASMSENLQYMARTHGFYLPYADYCVDIPGLLTYLLEMVYVGNVALLSSKQFHSAEAVQAHMRDKGACRIELEGHEEEYEAFYDLEALAEKSPLWQFVEEEASDGEWEDCDDGEDGGAAPMEEDKAAAAGTSAEGAESAEAEAEDDDELGRVFARAMSLGLMTEGQADRLTDLVAEGTISEAELLREWHTRLGIGLGPAASSESGVRSTVTRVRYVELSRHGFPSRVSARLSSRLGEVDSRRRALLPTGTGRCLPLPRTSGSARRRRTSCCPRAAGHTRRRARSVTARCAYTTARATGRAPHRSSRRTRSCTI